VLWCATPPKKQTDALLYLSGMSYNNAIAFISIGAHQRRPKAKKTKARWKGGIAYDNYSQSVDTISQDSITA
jgi:hypothetical protein